MLITKYPVPYCMTKTYDRLVEVFVKSDLRDRIRTLKKEKTYDEYLRGIVGERDKA